MSCSAFLQERIAKTEALIAAYEDAILALAEGGAIQQYTLDTSQTRQVVTRFDLPSLNRSLDSLYNRYATLLARCHGLGVVIAGPASRINGRC